MADGNGVLPTFSLPTGSLEVGGALVTFRALNRAEAVHAAELSRKATETGELEAAEVFILAAGLQHSEAEIQAWREASPMQEVGQLLDAIAELSGLTSKA